MRTNVVIGNEKIIIKAAVSLLWNRSRSKFYFLQWRQNKLPYMFSDVFIAWFTQPVQPHYGTIGFVYLFVHES